MLIFLRGANRPGAKRLGGRNNQGRNDLGRNAAGAKRLGANWMWGETTRIPTQADRSNEKKRNQKKIVSEFRSA